MDGTFATTTNSLPSAWLDEKAKLHTRRPETWANLSNIEAALLDFLRTRGKWSDRSSTESIAQLLRHFQEPERFDSLSKTLYERLTKIAHAELPRVRAMLGAIGQELGYSEDSLKQLRAQLSSYSRFDFGWLIALRFSKE